MEEQGIERRSGKRVPVEASLSFRRMGTPPSEGFNEQATVKNIGLGGLYFETDEAKTYSIDELLVTSVSIAEAHRRVFPFTRLAAPSRVVRVSELPPEGPGSSARIGVALEFGGKLIALTATPPRT